MKKLFVFLCILSFEGVIFGMENSKIQRSLASKNVKLRPAEEIYKVFKLAGLIDNQTIQFSKRYGGSYCNRDGIHFAISTIAHKSLMPISPYELQQLIFIKCVQE